MVWRRQVLRGEEEERRRLRDVRRGLDSCLTSFPLQVSADKLDSLTAFPKFFSQASYTKLASYRRAVFQALEVSFRAVSCPVFGSYSSNHYSSLFIKLLHNNWAEKVNGYFMQ